MGYGGLTIWGVTSITQIISFFALQDINLKVWMYLVTYGTLVVGVMYNIFMFLAINKASGKASDTTNTQDNTIGGLMLATNWAWLRTNAAYAFAGAILWGARKNFAKYQ